MGNMAARAFLLRCGRVSVFSLTIPAIPRGSHLTGGSSRRTFQWTRV